MDPSIAQPRPRAATLVRCLAASLDVVSLMILLATSDLGTRVVISYFNIARPTPIVELVQVGAILLFSSSEFWAQGSLGKYLCGIRIRTFAGERATIDRRIGRWSLKTIPLWLALVGVLLELSNAASMQSWLYAQWLFAAATFTGAGLFVAFAPSCQKTQQALYDMIARTAVYPATPEHLEPHRGFEPLMHREAR